MQEVSSIYYLFLKFNKFFFNLLIYFLVKKYDNIFEIFWYLKKIMVTWRQATWS